MQEGGEFLAAQQTQVQIQPSLTAFLFAANTSPTLGGSDGIVELLEEPALPAKVLIKSDVLCCWEEVWQQDVTAHEPRSEVQLESHDQMEM